jgi:hypothetical protein
MDPLFRCHLRTVALYLARKAAARRAQSRRAIYLAHPKTREAISAMMKGDHP